ncbi:MAG: class A beta-lactamase [Chthoniobacterales bacterium]|nr:class A beta-lactamase [Chthoniobacterales bacterium]
MFARSLSRLVCSLALLPLLHADGAEESPARKDTPENRIKAIKTRLGGRLGVAALDTGSGRRVEHRANERFPMCSTFKALAAAAVLHRVDEKKAELSDIVPYTEGDLLEYAPIAKKHVAEGGMTLAALCAAAIEYSDNTAANLLLQTMGGPAGLTRFVRSLGDEKTRLDRIEPDLNSALPGDERDTTTPRAMADTLRALLLGEALSAASRQQLESWLLANTTGGDLIRAGVPNDWKVGDKTGRGSNGATNDVAILRPPGKAPILLAIYSVESTAPRKEVQDAIAEVARIVAEIF